ncbi:hypothetical protein GGQ68_000244 [Sagittula marina]|uniref:Uncharacterized protein n=1 Tax=Sagittula marina TaxID=943940 RepID=A0A7W6DJ12_9RHOB|nr:hypothetical protein [Sagittula marina]
MFKNGQDKLTVLPFRDRSTALVARCAVRRCAAMILAGGVAVSLIGCEAVPPAKGGGKKALISSAATRPPPLAKVSLAGGEVIVAGPSGYCLDPETSKSAAGRGFAVIASCMILSGGQVGENVAPVMVTVTVGPRGTASDLPDGKALAAAAEAPLLAAGHEDGLVMAHLGAGGASVLEGGDTRYWRGAFLQGDRVVGLALYAPDGDALAGKRGAAMLVSVRDSIRHASEGGSVTTLTTATAPTKPATNNSLSRLFGG